MANKTTRTVVKAVALAAAATLALAGCSSKSSGTGDAANATGDDADRLVGKFLRVRVERTAGDRQQQAGGDAGLHVHPPMLRCDCR